MTPTLRPWIACALLAGLALCQTPDADGPHRADVDADRDIDTYDLLAYFELFWNAPVPGRATWADGDRDADADVDHADLLEFLDGYYNDPQPAPESEAPGVDIVSTVDATGRLSMTAVLADGTVLPFKTATPLTSTYAFNLPFAPPGAPPEATQVAGQTPLRLKAIPESGVSVADFRTRTDGFDIDIVQRNDTGHVRALRRIELDGFTFGGAPPVTAVVRNMARGGAPSTRGYDPALYKYPDNLYSAAQVIETDDWVLGVSLQYDVLDYEHACGIVSSRGSAAGQPWSVLFDLNTNRSGSAAFTANDDANLQPGESRVYTVSVRVMKPTQGAGGQQEWLRVLRPYRYWFRHTYGPVVYKRNPTPVSRYLLAQNANHDAATNPYGFGGLRPDLNGFAAVLAVMQARAADNWGRQMMWAPCGVFANPSSNFPPIFTSEWLAMPAVSDPPAIKSYSDGGGALLGLWWGRAGQYAEFWNDPALEPFDPDDAVQRAAMLAEMAGAAAVNADEIGLDAITHMEPWRSYWWIRDLLALHPDARFITEQGLSDLTHTIAPSYNRVIDSLIVEPDGTERLNNRFPAGLPIVDFINPGHEYWGSMRTSWVPSAGSSATDAEIADVLNTISKLGFVPTIGGSVFPRPPGAFEARETWNVTVPVDLR